jgi:hypothetical protein
VGDFNPCSLLSSTAILDEILAFWRCEFVLIVYFGLGRRSNRVTITIVDLIEPEDEVRDLPAAEILVLEEATEERVHLEESVKIDR